MTPPDNQACSDQSSPVSADQESNETAAQEVWTIKRLLDWTAEFFDGQNADQPRLDAEVLLAEALDCQRIDLYTRFDDEPTESQRDRYRQWVQRHGAGEPVAYLVGHREFFSLKFRVTRDVLIPRPETEHLVTESLDLIRAPAFSGRSLWVADIGTGAGTIAVAVAKHAPGIQIVATDVSMAALEVAGENAATHGVGPMIKFLESDLLSAVDEPALFDLIVSNPPYIGRSEQGQLANSVVDFEPHTALFAEGPIGTETIGRLVAEAPSRLKAGGYLLFEISPMIATACRQLIHDAPELQLQKVAKDFAGLERLVVARKQAAN